WPEAQAFSGCGSVAEAAQWFLEAGCSAVLIKGEHLASESVVNHLMLADGAVHEFETERLPGQFHGSGCTLASATATGLARGWTLVQSVEQGLAFTTRALSSAFAIGQGQHIPQRQLK
ncbi:MAG: bifunctional hydroxymethylpyrimidine kinase/phosphomethylpyrimidine kinase, partial [Limnobacter sp.]|nr:bifunctional hydroxymethylpyrimidine kinase/phosphomethylpyrimidine kinase [Limnobacter sp.]